MSPVSRLALDGALAVVDDCQAGLQFAGDEFDGDRPILASLSSQGAD